MIIITLYFHRAIQSAANLAVIERRHVKPREALYDNYHMKTDIFMLWAVILLYDINVMQKSKHKIVMGKSCHDIHVMKKWWCEIHVMKKWWYEIHFMKKRWHEIHVVKKWWYEIHVMKNDDMKFMSWQNDGMKFVSWKNNGMKFPLLKTPNARLRARFNGSGFHQSIPYSSAMNVFAPRSQRRNLFSYNKKILWYFCPVWQLKELRRSSTAMKM